jgi:hypothetical protein
MFVNSKGRLGTPLINKEDEKDSLMNSSVRKVDPTISDDEFKRRY